MGWAHSHHIIHFIFHLPFKCLTGLVESDVSLSLDFFAKGGTFKFGMTLPNRPTSEMLFRTGCRGPGGFMMHVAANS